MTGKLKDYLSLARISNAPTVISNVLAGSAAAGGLEQIPGVIELALSMLLFYTAGMFMNDLCDFRIDSQERPERPIASGRVSKKESLYGIIAMTAAGSLLLFHLGLKPFLGGLVLAGLIVVYNLGHARNPLSPLTMASCRAMIYVIAFIARKEAGNEGIGRWVARLLAGISLLDALILFYYHPGTPVLFPLACFGLTLILQRHIKGT